VVARFQTRFAALADSRGETVWREAGSGDAAGRIRKRAAGGREAGSGKERLAGNIGGELPKYLFMEEQVKDWAHKVIGAAIEVHRQLGPGYLERTYGDALAIELEERQVPFRREAAFDVHYKGAFVGHGRLDFLVAETLIVELKAVETLLPLHHAQVHAYLKTTDLRLGVLLNFQARVLRDGIARIIRT
jgi:GxxExxY protein